MIPPLARAPRQGPTPPIESLVPQCCTAVAALHNAALHNAALHNAALQYAALQHRRVPGELELSPAGRAVELSPAGRAVELSPVELELSPVELSSGRQPG